MTDAYLVLRAEQALIGAALVDPDRLRDVSYLKPAAFAHPTNRAIFVALSDGSGLGPGAANVFSHVAERVDLPGVTSEYLRTLAEVSRETASITVYGRLVEEAAVRRDLTAYADVIASESPGGADPQLDRLARALRQQTPVAAVAELAEAAPAPYAPVESLPSAPGTRAHQEELLLASLMTYPSQVDQIEWLAAEAFETGPRREIYAAIVAVSERGEPVEELTVIWEAERQRYDNPVAPGDPSPDTYGTERAHYLSRIAMTAVAAGLAVEIGGELLADELRTTLTVEAAKFTHGGSESRIAPTSPTPSDLRIDRSNPSSVQLPPRPAAPAPKPDIRP